MKGVDDILSGLKTDPPLYRSLSEKAYMIVRERILRNELASGSLLSRRKLAKELGMSLLPVSEALQRLESDGLVESKPRVGTRVRVLTAQDVRERYLVREALECQSARLFAEKASPRERRELACMAEHMDVLFNRSAAGDNDPELLYVANSYHFHLHLRIAECTGCNALRETIEKNHRLIFNWLLRVGPRTLPPRFHRELIKSISGSDTEVAEKAMREHIGYGLEEVLAGHGVAVRGE